MNYSFKSPDQKLMEKTAKSKFENLRDELKKINGDVKCVICHQSAFDNCYSALGLKEVLQSGICEKCFDKIFE